MRLLQIPSPSGIIPTMEEKNRLHMQASVIFGLPPGNASFFPESNLPPTHLISGLNIGPSDQ